MSIYYDPLSMALGIEPMENPSYLYDNDFEKNQIIVPWNKGKKGMQTPWNKGKTCREATKIKISQSVSRSTKGIAKTEEHKKRAGAASGKSRIGIKIKASQQRKDRISESNSKSWNLKMKDGSIIIIKNLKKYCKENNLSYHALRKEAYL